MWAIYSILRIAYLANFTQPDGKQALEYTFTNPFALVNTSKSSRALPRLSKSYMFLWRKPVIHFELAAALSQHLHTLLVRVCRHRWIMGNHQKVVVEMCCC